MEAGVGHILYTSAQRKSEDGSSPIALVADAHWKTDHLIKESGLTYTILKHGLYTHECFLDELAHRAKQDPLAFRLAMLTKESDTKRVLLKLKELSNWDKGLPKGKGRGIAQWAFFAGLCGQVVEVSKQKDGSIKVDRVIAVMELGKVVNPDNVKNQVEGAIVMALTAAIKPGITLAGGKIEQSNFHDSPLLRINEMPLIEVHILAEGGPMKGVGEPGLPPLAPALSNAIFAATGKRIRKLPIDLSAV